MVQIEKKGFVSSSYVFVNTLASIIMALFFSSIAWMRHAPWLELIGSFLLIGISSWFMIGYLLAPVAYKRYKINSEGIRCGKNFVKYSDIENISIVEGYIEEWRGFRSVENSTGIPRHTEIAIEDIISINCKFSGFKKKEASGCIYLPKTDGIDKLLRERCEAYAKASDEWAERRASFPRGLGMEKKNKGLITVFTIYNALLIVMGVVMFGGNFTEPYRLFVSMFFGFLMTTILSFKSYIVPFVSKKFMR